MLPPDLDAWLTDEGLRVAKKAAAQGSDRLDEREQLLNEFSLFDTEQRDGGVSQYFCNWGLERWRTLSRLATRRLASFSRFAHRVDAVVGDSVDPYSSVIESKTDLDAWYEQHQTELVADLRAIFDPLRRDPAVRKLRLMAEFGTWPLWEPGGNPYAVDPGSLPISAPLKAALKAWAAAWDWTLDQKYPPDSQFASPAEDEAFEREGRRLRADLQAELGSSFRVFYRSHRPPPVKWPFEDPRNVAVFSTADVIDRSLPIVHVTHDEDDGAWQFHSVNGAPDDRKECRLVGLEEIVKQDPSIAELADLPLGWRAIRSGPGAPWRRERRSGE